MAEKGSLSRVFSVGVPVVAVISVVLPVLQKYYSGTSPLESNGVNQTKHGGSEARQNQEGQPESVWKALVNEETMSADDVLAHTITGKWKRIKQVLKALKEGRVHVKGVIRRHTHSIPLLLAVAEIYVFAKKDDDVDSSKEEKRKRGVLEVMSEMLRLGANPDVTSEAIFGGMRTLTFAIQNADVPLCHCFVHGGASLGRGADGALRNLVYAWGSSVNVSVTISRLMAFRIEAANKKLSTANQRLENVVLNLYRYSSSMKRAVLEGANTSVANLIAKYCPRSEAQLIETEMFETLLSELMGAPDFDIIDAIEPGSAGQSSLHILSRGDPLAAHALVNAAAAKGKKMSAIMFKGLQMKDLQGRTPIHLAAVFYGSSKAQPPSMFRALLFAAERLSKAAGIAWASEQAFLSQLEPDKSEKLPPEYLGPNKGPVATTTSWSQREYTTDLSGGWSISRAARDGIPSTLDTTPAGQCQIKVLQSPATSQAIKDAILEAEPFLLRGGALDSKVRGLWTKSRFLERYGENKIRAGVIPYPPPFDDKVESMTIMDYVQAMSARSDTDESTAGAPPLYAFGSNLSQVDPWLQEDFGKMPEALDGIVVNNKDPEIVNTEFFLGAPESGSPFHFHVDAVNTLVYGRKRWFILPPDRSVYSMRPAAEMLSDELFAKGGSLESIQCVQDGGDILFMPNQWAHATINIEESIGVAHQFVLRGITRYEP